MVKLLCLICNVIVILDPPATLAVFMYLVPMTCALHSKGYNYKSPSTSKNNGCAQQLYSPFVKLYIDIVLNAKGLQMLGKQPSLVLCIKHLFQHLLMVVLNPSRQKQTKTQRF